MKNTIKMWGLIALVAAIGLSFVTCDYNPDEDGDGSFTMNGTANSNYSYDYRFLNQSKYEVTVTVGNERPQKLSPSAVFATTITHYGSRATVKYSPADKVKPEGSGTVYFRNK